MWFLIIRHRDPKKTIREKFQTYYQARSVLAILNDHDMEDILSISIEKI